MSQYSLRDICHMNEACSSGKALANAKAMEGPIKSDTNH